MSLESNRLLAEFFRFVIDDKDEIGILFSLNNYNKRRTKLLFLRNCLVLATAFLAHLAKFENQFAAARSELLAHAEHHSSPDWILDMDAIAKAETLGAESARRFVLEYATANERILETRKNLRVFSCVSAQTGTDILYKGRQRPVRGTCCGLLSRRVCSPSLGCSRVAGKK